MRQHSLMGENYYHFGPDPQIPGLCLTYQVSNSQERECDGSSLGQVPSPPPDVLFTAGKGDGGKHRCAGVCSGEAFSKQEGFLYVNKLPCKGCNHRRKLVFLLEEGTGIFLSLNREQISNK